MSLSSRSRECDIPQITADDPAGLACCAVTITGPSRTDAVPVGIDFAETKPSVERSRRDIIALNLQRGIAGARLLRPGKDLAEQRSRIALLPMLWSCHHIHNTERLRIDNPNCTGNRLIAIPERSEEARSRHGLQDRRMGVLLLERLPTQPAVERQPIRSVSLRKVPGRARGSVQLSRRRCSVSEGSTRR